MTSKTPVDVLIHELKSKDGKKKKAAKKRVTQEVWPDVKKIKDDVEKKNVLETIYQSIKNFFQHPVESDKKVAETKKYKNLTKATKKTLPDILAKKKLTAPQRKKISEILA
jgi:hypothetical protein